MTTSKIDTIEGAVAEYVTALPSRELWERKLHEAIARSRARLENRAEGEE